jgi:inorganic triphosphatase YgiF
VSEASAGREVELKLEIAERDLARLARHAPLLALAEGPASRQQLLQSVYYDTPDLALWRKGLVLRVRAAGRRRSVGVKTRGVVRGGLVVREEVEGPLAGAALDPRRVSRAALLASIAEPRLRRALEQAASGQRLAPRVETRFQRRTLRLRLGAATIELALDQGEVRAGRSRLPIHELELELLSGHSHALFDLALRLAGDFELRPASLGKAERGFARLLGAGPSASRAAPVVLGPASSLDDTVRSVLGECMRHLTANQLAAERSEDPEGVHQMRVGARRLRSALRLFDAWLPVRAAQAFAEELRWLGRELGRARDLDVFALELLGPLARSRPEDAGLAALSAATESARAEAHAAVRTALRSQRYVLFVLRLGRSVEGTPLRRGQLAVLHAPARRAIRPLLYLRAEHLEGLAERLDQLSARELHRLRIRTKRLRYAIELVGPLFGEKEAARSARRLAELQDALGHLNDLANAEALLTQLRDRLGPAASAATARAEGFVLGYAARSVSAGRDALAEAWRRATRQRPFWEPAR